jgi:hypothetical protein
LGEKKLSFGANLFWERKSYFWTMRHMWQKNNMQKMKEKQHAEDGGKTAWHACRQT